MSDFFPTKDDADNQTTGKGGPKQLFPGSAAKGKKIKGGSKEGKEYKQETKFGNKK
jgi:hypothetical protein